MPYLETLTDVWKGGWMMTKMTTFATVAASAFFLVGCTDNDNAEVLPPEERMSGEDVWADPDRYVEVGEQMQERFNIDGDPNLVFMQGLQHCSILYGAYDREEDVQAKYQELVAEYGPELADSRGHWVDMSIEEFCPDLEAVVDTGSN